MFINLYLINNIGRHTQTVLQFLESRQEYFLDNLQITEIAAWQVIHDQNYLLRQSLNLVTFCPCQFEYIRILLVWHNAGSCCTVIRQLHETKILGIKETGIKSQFGYRSGNTCQSKGYIAFHLSASHLSIHHIIVHGVKTQQFRRHRTVQGKRRTIACRRSQGIPIGHLKGCLQEQHIIYQTLCISTEPKSETGRHSHLQMRISRHQYVLITVALCQQFIKQHLYLFSYLLQLGTGK